MAAPSVNTNPSLPAPAGAAVVPGMSASATTAPAAPVAGGGGAAVDPAQLLVLLTTLITLLKSMPGAQGAQVGAAGVQGGGAAASPGVSGLGATTMGGGYLIGGTQPSVDPFGALGSTVGGALLSGTPGTATSLSTGSVPSYMPSLGSIIGGGGAYGSPAAGADFGTASFGTTTPAPAPVAGGGAAAAPVATPQVDMRRVLGTPRPGDVIDTIIRSARPTAQASRSEGQYIVLQDGNGAQLQAHVHGAWSSHPTRIAEGIQRGFIQVHVHEDGTLHLHDVV